MDQSELFTSFIRLKLVLPRCMDALELKMIIFHSIFISAIFVIILLVCVPSVLLIEMTAVSNDTHAMFNDF